MYIKYLPPYYKILACIRRAEHFQESRNTKRFQNLGHTVDCFDWVETTESAHFWADVHYATSDSDLPDIDKEYVIRELTPYLKTKHYV